MKKLTNLLLALTLIFNFSCSKTNDDTDNTQNEDLEAHFSGNMITGNINNEIDGKVSITETGNFTLESFSGRITGDAELENDIYTISNLSGDGAFEGSSFTDGQLNLNNLNLNLSGNYVDSNPILINGGVEIIWIEEYEQMWTDARTKSSVFFSHNELCTASITIEGVTLDGLDTHYHENGALCDQSYYGELFTTKYHQDVDNDISEIFCNTAILFNPLTGEFVTNNWCTISKFIVDKNTQYTYTVNWDNGYSYTDIFMSADGGQGVTICPTNSGEDCDGSGGGSGGSSGVQEIIENTLVIDYANSDTTESGQFDFSNLCMLEPGSSEILHFGDIDGNNSVSWLKFSPFTLQEGTYDLSDPLTSVSAKIISDGMFYHYFQSGTIDVTFFERYPDGGGEIHMTFYDAHLETFFPDDPGYIEFSGTLKARWEE